MNDDLREAVRHLRNVLEHGMESPEAEAAQQWLDEYVDRVFWKSEGSPMVREGT